MATMNYVFEYLTKDMEFSLNPESENDNDQAN